MFRSVDLFDTSNGVRPDLAMDSEDNLIMAINYSTSLTLGTTTFTNPGYEEAILAKFDDARNLLWTRQWRVVNARIATAVVDSSNNILMLAMGWQSGIFHDVSVSSTNSQNAVLFKLDPNGNVLWHRLYEGLTPGPGSQRLGLDGAENIYVAGRFENDDVFLQKLDPTGTNVLWTKREGKCALYIGSSGPEISIGADGSLFLYGHLTNATASFGSVTVTNQGGSDSYVVKYNTEGIALRASIIRGTNPHSLSDIVADDDGNCYLAFVSPYALLHMGTNSFTNLGVLKILSDGNFGWARNLRNDSLGGGPIASSVGLTPDGSVVFNGSMWMGGDRIEAAIVKLSSSGDVIWRKTPNALLPSQSPPAPWYQLSAGIELYSRPVFNTQGLMYVAGRMYSNGVDPISFDSLVVQPDRDNLVLLTLAPSPPLSISFYEGLLTLSWPTNESGFVLEVKEGFDDQSSWEELNIPVTIVAGRYTATNGIPLAQRFYRLSK